MIVKSYNVKEIAGDRVFSAEGSNILFDHISEELKEICLTDEILVELSFGDVAVVSTAFIGRFQEHVATLKSQYLSLRFRLTELRREIKSQFLKK